jgi:signal peptide peptidase SppA
MSFGSLQRRILGPIIPIVRVQGIINDIAVSKLEKSLANFRPERAQALAVLVNSPGGLVAPCHSMTEMLRNFTKKHNLPLYAFSDCMALSGGYFIVSAGNKVYADKTSWVGSIGVITQYSQIQGLLKKYGVDVKTWKSNEDLFAPLFDPSAEVNKESMNKNLTALCKEVHEGFVQHIESYRDRKIKVPKEERYDKIYQGGIWTGKEALELGLIDGLGTFQEILGKEFPDAKLVEVTQTSALERFRERIAMVENKITTWDEQSFLQNVTQNFSLKK